MRWRSADRRSAGVILASFGSGWLSVSVAPFFSLVAAVSVLAAVDRNLTIDGEKVIEELGAAPPLRSFTN
jgi:hypothetical protein